jgi:hypothetical protein
LKFNQLAERLSVLHLFQGAGLFVSASSNKKNPMKRKITEISCSQVPLSDIRKHKLSARRGRAFGVVHELKQNALVSKDSVPVVGAKLADCALQLSEAVGGITELSLQLLNLFGISHKDRGGLND